MTRLDPSTGGMEEVATTETNPTGQEGDVGCRQQPRQIITQAGHHDHIQWPALTIETATPSPHPPQTPDINNNINDGSSSGNNANVGSGLQIPLDDALKEEDGEDVEEFSEDGVEEGEGGEEDEDKEQGDQEEEDAEMLPEEKKDMHECVKSGDVDSLEDCLDLPNADINMIWFRENLLMTAIRYGQQEMAFFLLDNGVDHTYTTSIMGMRETSKGKIFERYQLDCRQMAYDSEMFDIVDLIDSLQGKLFPFVRLPERTIRLRRPRPPTPSQHETESDASSEGADISSSAGSDEEGKEVDSEGRALENSDGLVEGQKARRRKHRKLRKKGSKKHGSEVGGTGDGGQSELDGKYGRENEDRGDSDKNWMMRGASSTADVDSGHHSLTSSKLKMSQLREHDRLMEKEEAEEEGRRAVMLDQDGKKGTSPRCGEYVDNAAALSERGSKFRGGSMKSNAQRSSEKSAGEEEGVVQERDEGYGGSVTPLSLSSPAPWLDMPPVPPPEPARPWEAPPKNRIRNTKSALTLQGSRYLRETRRALSGGAKLPSRYARSGYSSILPSEDGAGQTATESPLRWRKVSTAGSYARESKRWHNSGSSDISTSASTTVEISELEFLTTGSATIPSSVTPSTMAVGSSTTSLSLPRSIEKPTTAGTASAPSGMDGLSTVGSSSAAKPALRKPLDAPSYMRATKSTAVKCRLTSQFSSSYGALSFQVSVLTNGRLYPSTAGTANRQNPLPNKSNLNQGSVERHGLRSSDKQTHRDNVMINAGEGKAISGNYSQNGDTKSALASSSQSARKSLSSASTSSQGLHSAAHQSHPLGRSFNIPVIRTVAGQHQKRNHSDLTVKRVHI